MIPHNYFRIDDLTARILHDMSPMAFTTPSGARVEVTSTWNHILPGTLGLICLLKHMSNFPELVKVKDDGSYEIKVSNGFWTTTFVISP